MTDRFDDQAARKIKRREILSAAALPVAAALAPLLVSAQERRSSRGARDRIRVGIIGAGGIVGSTHVPGLRKMPGVDIVAVANRSLESSERAATALGIPRAYADWQQLIAADGIDAVLIGTWPYMHRAITLAALDSGRHVLCQARMANDSAEARDMLAASERHPNLVCQLVPTSGSYRIDRALQGLLGGGGVGDVLSVEVQMLQRGFANFAGELDWRHDPELSGINVLNVGGTYESVMRWLGPGNRVMGMTRVHIPMRRDEQGGSRAATIPDHVEVLDPYQGNHRVGVKQPAAEHLQDLAGQPVAQAPIDSPRRDYEDRNGKEDHGDRQDSAEAGRLEQGDVED